MDKFFQVVGIITCCLMVILVLGVLYWLYVRPAIQALSLARWYYLCSKAAGVKNSKFPWLAIFTSYYEVGGVRFTATRNDFGEWRGIGDWDILEPEDDKAP